ncbi:alpha/beta fold hydrolase [Neobacillus sp. NPDC093127]|uniref:alpha/beta fold hydrolase n=1 Tax=Neobacillus sp. NPDC093127 TaxID=3364296 RepID=UPI0037F36630
MPIVNTVSSSLFYSVQGEGTPILFIHPPLLTSANFIYQMKELSRYFKVITFDIRGHGRSAYSKEPITYQLIANDIKHLLNHLGIDKTFLCGYSTGGSIVLEFLLAYPNRALGGIIVSGMSEVRDGKNEARISIARILTKAGAMPLLGLSVAWSNSNTIEIFKNIYREALKSNSRNVEQYYHSCLKYNCTNKLKTIQSPVLLIYGEKDIKFHTYAKLLHEKLPNNELTFLHEKHQIPTKSADELNQLIQGFITEIMKG